MFTRYGRLTLGWSFRPTFTRPRALILGKGAANWLASRPTAICWSPEGNASSSFCRATAIFWPCEIQQESGTTTSIQDVYTFFTTNLCSMSTHLSNSVWPYLGEFAVRWNVLLPRCQSDQLCRRSVPCKRGIGWKTRHIWGDTWNYDLHI